MLGFCWVSTYSCVFVITQLCFIGHTANHLFDPFLGVMGNQLPQMNLQAHFENQTTDHIAKNLSQHQASNFGGYRQC